jgi:hypothetical protein
MSQQVLKLLVANKDRNVFSFGWRIWAGGTSFYIKCITPLSPFKLSLHGPDPRHRWHGFKLDLDGPQTASSGYLTAKPDWLPAIFPGKEVSPDASLAFRLRVPWDVFDQPGPPPPADLPTGQQGYIAVVPPAPQAADFDFYVSSTAPYWPNRTQAARDNAMLGPLTNESGQHLTVVSYRRNVLITRTPPKVLGRQPANVADRIRGLGGGVDDDGVLWMVEQWLSVSALATGDPEAVSTPRPARFLDQAWRADQIKPSGSRDPFHKDAVKTAAKKAPRSATAEPTSPV